MKKIVSIILSLIMCTAAVSAAVPETLGGKKVYKIATVGKSNIDAGTDTSYTGTVRYQDVGSSNLARVLKYPDNPDAAGDYCIKHMTNDTEKAKRLITPDAVKYTNSVWATTIDLKVEGPTLKKTNASFKVDNAWVGLAFVISADGNVTFGGNGHDNLVYQGFKADNWYNITFIVDVINDKIGTIIKDIDGNGEEIASDLFDFYLKNETEPYDMGFVSYVEIQSSSADHIIYTDDVENFILAYAPGVLEIYGADANGNKLDDGIDFKNPYIIAEIDGTIDATTIGTDAIKLMLGDREIPQIFTFDEENNSFMITPSENLLPNTEYSVVISEDVKSINSIAFDTLTYTVSTMREYYSVAGIETSDISSGSEFTVSVTLNNRDNVQSTDTLVAAAYDEDGALCSVNAVEVTNPVNKAVIPVTLKAPTLHTVSKIDVLFIKSLTVQSFIDIYSVTLPAE